MTKVYRQIQDVKLTNNTILTIGTFDGVHLGHKKILNQLLQKKQETGFETFVFTFDPHPRKVLFPEQSDLKLITETEEKINLLNQSGIDHVLLYPFNKTFSEISPEDYISNLLVAKLKAKYIIVGYDHRFGKNRAGNLELLLSFSEKYNYKVIEIAAEDIDSINISSTQIRKAIEAGEIQKANQFLGYDFFVTGKVIEGKKLGRTIGFPTANIILDSADKIIPKQGVYAVNATIRNKTHNGMLNLGINPTVSTNNQLKMEVHLFDFNELIYGETIKIEFKERIRDEKKFTDLNQLKEQLHIDKKNAIDFLNNYSKKRSKHL